MSARHRTGPSSRRFRSRAAPSDLLATRPLRASGRHSTRCRCRSIRSARAWPTSPIDLPTAHDARAEARGRCVRDPCATRACAVLVPAVETEPRLWRASRHAACFLLAHGRSGKLPGPKHPSARGNWLLGVFCQEIKPFLIDRRLAGGRMSASWLPLIPIRKTVNHLQKRRPRCRTDGPGTTGPRSRTPSISAAHGRTNACVRERGTASVMLQREERAPGRNSVIV